MYVHQVGSASYKHMLEIVRGEYIEKDIHDEGDEYRWELTRDFCESLRETCVSTRLQFQVM